MKRNSANGKGSDSKGSGMPFGVWMWTKWVKRTHPRTFKGLVREYSKEKLIFNAKDLSRPQSLVSKMTLYEFFLV